MNDFRRRLLEWIRTAGTVSFSRSGGPGGQSVNKSNTKVTLKLPVRDIPGLDDAGRERVMERLSGRVNAEGELIVQSDEARGQLENRRRAELRAVTLIAGAASPRRRRKPTRPGRGAKERRLKEKRRRGEIKGKRKPPEPE
ncbi:MAG: alternative ribosome rescue aminoacyl-tRNA hydrolase ArfB [Spirochaetota bacterium]